MVLGHENEHPSRWTAVSAIAAKTKRIAADEWPKLAPKGMATAECAI